MLSNLKAQNCKITGAEQSKKYDDNNFATILEIYLVSFSQDCYIIIVIT